MTIDVKVNSSELAGILRSGAYELADGSTVADLMEIAQREAEFEMTREMKSNLVFLFDNRHASLETVLNGNGMLRVLHKVLGG